MVSRFSEKVKPVLEVIKNKIENLQTAHFDETGSRVDGKTRWIHDASTFLYTIERLYNYKVSVSLFFNDFRVEFDNNQAGRDLRIIKLKTKVSGCFRSEDEIRDYLAVMSYVGTAKKHGINAFQTILNVFECNVFLLLKDEVLNSYYIKIIRRVIFMKKTKILVAGLMSISILLANIIPVYANDTDLQLSDNSTVSDNLESQKTPCLVSVMLIDDFNVKFLDEYKKSLVEEGKTQDEAKSIVRALNGQINENGKISDPDIEARRLEYRSLKIDEELDRIVSEIGIERSDAEIVMDGLRCNIKVSLTAEQIKVAESLTGCYVNVSTGEEAVKYNGKITNQALVNSIREGKDQFRVVITLGSSTVGMSESECKSYVVETFAPLNIYSFENINYDKGNSLLYVYTTISGEQLIKVCELESVTGVGSIGDTPSFVNPVVTPNSFVEPIGDHILGDLNYDLVVDLTDLSELSLYLIGDGTISEYCMQFADVDKDKKVTLMDLARMRQYISKVIDEL